MKAAVYSPYLDSLGGGERYMLTIAEILSQRFETDLLIDPHLGNLGIGELKKKLEKRLNLDLSRVKIVKAPLGGQGNFLDRANFFKKYDLLFYLTDGSVFYATAKKNILHIQSPLVSNSLKSVKSRIKLRSWDLIIYNSEFTKHHAEKYWKKKGVVLYPPVDIEEMKSLKKKDQILSVGRFFGHLKEKKQEVMMDAFINLCQQKDISGWSLHLAGGAGEGDKSYLEELRKKAKGYPIIFHPNISFKDLVKLYGESSIYWHAMGYGEEDPTKMEHFGIATVEAMAAGCVPVVINKGGQREIVENDKSGFLWDTLEELEKITFQLIQSESLRREIEERAIERSKKFSSEKFQKELLKLTND